MQKEAKARAREAARGQKREVVTCMHEGAQKAQKYKDAFERDRYFMQYVWHVHRRKVRVAGKEEMCAQGRTSGRHMLWAQAYGCMLQVKGVWMLHARDMLQACLE